MPSGTETVHDKAPDAAVTCPRSATCEVGSSEGRATTEHGWALRWATMRDEEGGRRSVREEAARQSVSTAVARIRVRGRWGTTHAQVYWKEAGVHW